jgi:hypothetical protein
MLCVLLLNIRSASLIILPSIACADGGMAR